MASEAVPLDALERSRRTAYLPNKRTRKIILIGLNQFLLVRIRTCKSARVHPPCMDRHIFIGYTNANIRPRMEASARTESIAATASSPQRQRQMQFGRRGALAFLHTWRTHEREPSPGYNDGHGASEMPASAAPQRLVEATCGAAHVPLDTAKQMADGNV